LECVLQHRSMGKYEPLSTCNCGYVADFRTKLSSDGITEFLNGSFESQWEAHIRSLIGDAQAALAKRDARVRNERDAEWLKALGYAYVGSRPEVDDNIAVLVAHAPVNDERDKAVEA